MGDMADFTLEQIGDDDYFSDTTLPTCKYCKTPNLIWGKIGERWFLYDSVRKLHDCPKNPLSITDLKEIAKFKRNCQILNESTYLKTKKDMIPNSKWKDVLNCENEYYKDDRLSKDEYGCLIALSVASRSEDPHTSAGACVTNKDGKIISTGYNGLLSGMTLPSILSKEEYRDVKRTLFIHAEMNALSLINQGEGHTIYLNMNPCVNCAVNIAAHGIKNVVFVKEYHQSQEYKHVFDFYDVYSRQITSDEKTKINNFINSKLIIPM